MYMYLVVGLGNPGAQYEKTRHNIGFQVVEAFLQKNFASASFRFDQRINAFTLEETWNRTQLVLVKPQTFMNKSGNAVKLLYQKHIIRDWILEPAATAQFSGKHLQNERGIYINPFGTGAKRPPIPWQSERADRHMIVIHDDIDLLLGKTKISLGSSSGGHKGVESIIQEIGTKDFARIRLGIQPEGGKPANVEEFVVQKFTLEEKPVVETAVLNAVHALEIIFREGIEKAMNEYN
ncbi:MAG TPA: aminoacyl-tRNA hydrolase [Candidatus Paceibacterota bacterium]